ncbi:2OG-Fe(II) oxygenase [Oceanicoccus sp. KOV_DT_Chl]|uniref:2OG-Fe(II) oxygenase n=1 Tax=Oceanicoccus sp. KOV_DT_Chl TaxID=1904639 RepID=UPI000C7CE087|nr:2OG-Fe(II) oxygenase [Oceanicoccus sp. KOV_DT_Chl]
MLDINAFNNTPLKLVPYPYMVVKHSLRQESVAQLLQDFPKLDHAGSIPVESVDYGVGFEALLNDLNSDEFRQAVAKKFDVNLDEYPIMTTVRGVMRQKDGRIHTDSKTKVITILIYFNEEWEDDSGHLRILKDGQDIENFVEEIPPSLGTMVAFRVTDNCWHGHKPVVGKRLSIQMNYLVGETAKGKHQFFHGLSARLKKMFSK